MSRPGNPYDNAKAESFMATLKREQIDGRAYRDLADAKADIGTFIDDVYNRERLHSALGYRSPEEFETWQRASLPPGVAGAARPDGSAPPTPNPDLEPQTTLSTMQLVSP
jgi:putative transposase